MTDTAPEDRRIQDPIRLSVVFDTNSIFTESRFQLLSEDVKRLVGETLANTTLQVEWLLPGVVLNERLFRMREKASALHQSATDISSLTGRDMGVSRDDLLGAVDARAQEALKQLGIRVVDPDWVQIDWQRLVGDAINRRPPFSPGASEKGFRDAIVLETFLQVLARLRSPRHHAVLVTSDDLLQKAVQSRTGSISQAYPPGSLEHLRGLIAALAGELQVELINRLTPVASALFFTPGQNASLFTASGISTRIQTEYESAFLTVPPGAEFRNTYAPTIHPSRFVKKEDNRFHWANQIIFPSVAYRIAYLQEPTSSSSPQMVTGTYSTNLFTEDADASAGGAIYGSSSPLSVPHPSSVAVSTGGTVFEAVWSAVYSTEGAFAAPKLEDLIFRGTEWS